MSGESSARVREARAEELGALARLCGELGYPVAQEDLARRIAALDANERHALLVADEAGAVLGLGHVILRRSLLVAPYAELAALIVDERARDKGLGALLLRAAEAWSASQGVGALRVRSRVQREDAHRFYQTHGYALVKTQRIFSLDLGGRAGSGTAVSGGAPDPVIVD